MLDESMDQTDNNSGNRLAKFFSLKRNAAPMARHSNLLLTIVFLIVAIPSCLFDIMMVPPGQVADEVAHALRVDGVSRGIFLGHREVYDHPNGNKVAGGGITADPALLQVGNVIAPGQAITREQSETLPLQRWTKERRFFDIGPIATYLPVYYVPGGLATALARPFVNTPYAVFLFGRMGSALAFLAMGVWALMAARRGGTLLFCTLAVPMTLSLAASLNQDGLIIASAVLGVAMLTRLDAASDALRRPAWWVAAAAFLAIGLAKPPYIPLLGLLFLPLPPWAQWRVLLPRLFVVLGAAVLIVGWAAVAQGLIAGPVLRPPESLPDPLGGAPIVYESPDPARQLAYVLAHPALILTLPWGTLLKDRVMPWMMVGILGWLRILLPVWFYHLWYVGFACAGAADLCHGGARKPGLLGVGLVLLVLFACVEGIYLSQYLVWTHLQFPSVAGPQGRYLLPLVPVLVLALPALRARWRMWAPLAAIPAFAALAGLAVVPERIIAAFYLH